MDIFIATVEVDIDIYVKGRDMPIGAPTQFTFRSDDLPDSVEELTDRATNFILGKMDSKSCIYLAFESSRNSKVIVATADIVSFNVRAPDELPEMNPIEFHLDEDGDD